jgi:4,5-dihydroxyphthalate decarboxylase
VKITAAVGAFDRTQPLLDGRVGVEGYDVAWTSGELESLFSRAFETAEFDVTELSFCNYLIAAARGGSPYVAMPIFPTRCFRHHAFFVRTDRGIHTPKDLEGSRIGLREYTNTVSLVARGILQSYYRVDLSRIHWVVGDVDQRERNPAQIKAPALPGMDITTAGPRLLGGMLASGAIDGLISYTPPRALGAPGVGRLFERWWEDEQRYFKDTGIFPIMHVVAIKRALVERHPTLPGALYRAFCEAKAMTIRDLEIEQAPKTMLPWAPAHLMETRRALGDDFWPYGVDANRVTLEAQIGWAFQQGLIERVVPLDEFFVDVPLASQNGSWPAPG